MTATEELSALVAQRASLRAKVDELDAELRAATEAAETARSDLVELERRSLGGESVPAQARRQAEETLTRARLKRAEPWAERIAGARAAVNDAHRQVQVFVGEHLDELVAQLEEDGRVAAAALTDAAQKMISAYAERERVAGEISALVSLVTSVQPGDVSRSRAEALVRAASALVGNGGEEPPTLLRRPRQAVEAGVDAVPAA